MGKRFKTYNKGEICTVAEFLSFLPLLEGFSITLTANDKGQIPFYVCVDDR